MYRVNSVWLGNILPLRRLREKKVCQSTLIHSTYCSQKFVLSHYFRSTHIASLPQCMIEECKQCMMWLCSPWRVPNSSFFSSAPKSAILLTVSKHCFCQKVNLIIVLLSRHLICFCLGKKNKWCSSSVCVFVSWGNFKDLIHLEVLFSNGHFYVYDEVRRTEADFKRQNTRTENLHNTQQTTAGVCTDLALNGGEHMEISAFLHHARQPTLT